MVGQRLVEALQDRDTECRWRVTVLSEEPRRAYDRVALSSYFDGVAADEPGSRRRTAATARGGYDAAPGRGGHRHRPRGAHRHHQPSAPSIGYDALVLATGSYPFVPAGARQRPARLLRLPHPRRPRRDPRGGAAAAATRTRGRAGLVVGGGLLGLEAARALRLLGMSPHVVELAPRLMPLQVDEGGGALLREMIENLNVTVRLGTSVSRDRARRVEAARHPGRRHRA